jgi:PKD repeat protein
VNFTDWAWDFGDETTGGGQEVTHMYAEPGTYTVTLRVTFEGGTSCSAREEIVVAPAADNASAGEEVETPTEVITEEPTEEATERPTEEVTPGEGEIL